jgi:hypothetical protein
MGTVTVTYTPALMSRAVACAWRRQIGWRGLVVFGLLLACIGLLWSLGDWTWYLIAAVTAAVLMLVIFVTAYAAHRRRVLKHLQRLEGGFVQFAFDDDGLGINNSLGNSTLKWTTFEKLWRFPDVWLLFISKGQYIILPTAELPPEALTLVERKVEVKR